MKCQNCGKEIDEGVDFCYFCGSAFNDDGNDNMDNLQNEEIESECKTTHMNTQEAKIEIETSYDDDKDAIIYATSSSVGKAIKVLSIIVLVLSAIGSFVIMGETFAIGVAALLISILTSLLSYGIGEIVCLLTSINHKL